MYQNQNDFYFIAFVFVHNKIIYSFLKISFAILKTLLTFETN